MLSWESEKHDEMQPFRDAKKNRYNENLWDVAMGCHGI